MMLTRSFITSYFILPDDEMESVKYIMQGVRLVNKDGYLHVKEPSEEEKRDLNNAIIKHTGIHQSQREIVEEILDEIGIPKKQRDKFHRLITLMAQDEFDKDRLYEIIQTNYNMMN